MPPRRPTTTMLLGTPGFGQFPRILETEFCGVQLLGITVEPKPLVSWCAKWPSTEARRGRRGDGLGFQCRHSLEYPEADVLATCEWDC
jgi:hypothetical protein